MKKITKTDQSGNILSALIDRVLIDKEKQEGVFWCLDDTYLGDIFLPTTDCPMSKGKHISKSFHKYYENYYEDSYDSEVKQKCHPSQWYDNPGLVRRYGLMIKIEVNYSKDKSLTLQGNELKTVEQIIGYKIIIQRGFKEHFNPFADILGGANLFGFDLELDKDLIIEDFRQNYTERDVEEFLIKHYCFNRIGILNLNYRKDSRECLERNSNTEKGQHLVKIFEKNKEIYQLIEPFVNQKYYEQPTIVRMINIHKDLLLHQANKRKQEEGFEINYEELEKKEEEFKMKLNQKRMKLDDTKFRNLLDFIQSYKIIPIPKSLKDKMKRYIPRHI